MKLFDLFEALGKFDRNIKKYYGDDEDSYIVKNPTRNFAKAMAMRSKNQNLRYIIDPRNDDLYIADAYNLMHPQIAELVGIPNEISLTNSNNSAGTDAYGFLNPGAVDIKGPMFADDNFERRDPNEYDNLVAEIEELRSKIGDMARRGEKYQNTLMYDKYIKLKRKLG